MIGLSDPKAFRKRISALRKAIVILDEGLISVSNRDRRTGIGSVIAKVSAIAAHRRIRTMITAQAHRIDIQLRELADTVVIKKTNLSRLLLLDSPHYYS